MRTRSAHIFGTVMGTHCWRQIRHSMVLRMRSKRGPQYEHVLMRLLGKPDKRGSSAAVIPDKGAAHGSRTSSGSCVADETPDTINFPPSVHDSGMCAPGPYHRFLVESPPGAPHTLPSKACQAESHPTTPEEGREPC